MSQAVVPCALSWLDGANENGVFFAVPLSLVLGCDEGLVVAHAVRLADTFKLCHEDRAAAYLACV